MIKNYIEAIRDALTALATFLTPLALPLAIVIGLLLGIVVLIVVLQRDKEGFEPLVWRRFAADSGAGVGLLLFLVISWAALRTTRDLAQQAIRRQASAEATSHPVTDAPPVEQAGPSVASLGEKTYTRSLALPPGFLGRIGTEGVSVLAPYLADPSAENVVRLRDSFRRSGGNVVFDRQTTVLNEEPIPFSDSQVHVKIERLPGRAYNANFEGHYTFENSSAEVKKVHFLFTLPQAGTMQKVSVKVGGAPVTELGETQSLADSDSQPPTGPRLPPGAPSAPGAPGAPAPAAYGMPGASAVPGTYEWRGEMKPGEKQEAVVTYQVIGARIWSYDLGSLRRRVKRFHLDIEGAGDIGYMRGSLDPTAENGGKLAWDLSDVVTAQEMAIVIPRDGVDEQLYLQALAALPASFFLFLFGLAAMWAYFRPRFTPGLLLGCLALFLFGLGSTPVLALGFGLVSGTVLGPLLGAFMVARVLGRRSLLVGLPCALLPAAFLSAKDSGFLVFLLVIVSLGAFFKLSRAWKVDDEAVTVEPIAG